MNIVYPGKILAIELKRVTAILLLSLSLQFMVHLAPYYNGMPLGARLLVMFYAPLVAVIFFGLRVGVISAFLAPALNWLLTGQPRAEMIFVLTAELVIFTIVSYLISARFKGFWLAALVSYLLSVAICALLLGHSGFFFNSVAVSLPGLLVLSLLNLLLCKFRSKWSYARN